MPTKEAQLERLILRQVSLQLAVIGRFLMLNVMTEMNPQKFDKDTYNRVLASLIEREEIVRITARHSKFHYDLYFPKGTVFELGDKYD